MSVEHGVVDLHEHVAANKEIIETLLADIECSD
jgi:hypothetical protein